MFRSRGSLFKSAISLITLFIFRRLRFSLSDTGLKNLLNERRVGIKRNRIITHKNIHTNSKLFAEITLRSHGMLKEMIIAPNVPPAAIKGKSLPALRESIMSFASVQNKRKRNILEIYEYEKSGIKRKVIPNETAHQTKNSIIQCIIVKIRKNNPRSTLSINDIKKRDEKKRNSALTMYIRGIMAAL